MVASNRNLYTVINFTWKLEFKFFFNQLHDPPKWKVLNSYSASEFGIDALPLLTPPPKKKKKKKKKKK